MAMNLKKVTKKLTSVRDSIRAEGKMTDEAEEILKSLVNEPVTVNQRRFRTPQPDNDNQPLSPEQKFRLRLMEKTGTGSTSIH
jgi:hypothetical protein